MALHEATATEALAKFKDGSWTVEQYARSLLSRIQQRDSDVKAWAYLNPELILKQAKELDQIPPENRGPLHGIPIGIKDIIFTKGMPTEYGSPIYKGSSPELDAASISVLRHAGALIFGKTTTTEFAASQQGCETRNACDPNRTPGGSSSGSGAAVADYQVPLALGSQTGGSIIRPASFNGTYGYKPTWGSVSREGQKFHSVSLDTVGFFARSVPDLRLLADVFALRDDQPPSTAFRVEGARFALARTPVWPKAGPGTVTAFIKAAELLRAKGAQVEELELPVEFGRVPEWHKVLIAADGRTTFLPEYRAAADKLWPPIRKYVEDEDKPTRAQFLEAFDGIAALRPKIDEIASRYAAIVTPSVIDEAPMGLHSTGDYSFNAIWTALHVPVVNVPGLSGLNGMPVGISLVAPRYHDQHLLVVAEEVGKVFEGEYPRNTFFTL